jgi:hypothetical protein
VAKDAFLPDNVAKKEEDAEKESNEKKRKKILKWGKFRPARGCMMDGQFA